MKIGQAGVYDIPMEVYHSDCCVGPSVSSGGLNTINNKSPAIYWGQSYLNPDCLERVDTEAMRIGKAAHSLALGEPNFAEHFVVSPHEEFRTNEAKAWRDAAQKSGKVILKKPQFEMVRDMAAALVRSPQCARAFKLGKPERSLIWRDEETGVWLKSRPDYLPDDPASGFVIDYKTTADLRPRKFSAQAFDMGWHLQAALQVDACRIVLGVEPLGIAHVAQEKTPPYLAELRLFTPEQIDFGRREYRRALRIFADCWSRGKWPGYTAEASYHETPYYIAKQMMESESNGFEADCSGNQTRDPADYLSA